MVYNAIAGGMLSGKYHSKSEREPENTRFRIVTNKASYCDRYWHDRELATVEALRPEAVKAGVFLATLSVAWVLANPVITSAIVGASRPEQLNDSLKAIEVDLLGSQKQVLDELTHEYRYGDALR
jgi:aryl-alcohol dehydrogenase (NADP+)